MHFDQHISHFDTFPIALTYLEKFICVKTIKKIAKAHPKHLAI